MPPPPNLRKAWDLQPGGKYFFTRNGSTLMAFAVGGAFNPTTSGFMIIGVSECALGVHPSTRAPLHLNRHLNDTTTQCELRVEIIFFFSMALDHYLVILRRGFSSSLED